MKDKKCDIEMDCVEDILELLIQRRNKLKDMYDAVSTCLCIDEVCSRLFPKYMCAAEGYGLIYREWKLRKERRTEDESLLFFV